MGKIKNLFFNISGDIKKTYRKFPITIILIYLLTIFIIIKLNSIIPIDITVQIYTVISLSIVGIFLTETVSKNNLTKIVGTGISVGIGVILNLLIKNNANDFIYRLVIAYTIILPLISIYVMSKKQNVKFEEYVIKVFSNLCKNLIVYIILNIGIAIVMSIFIALILDGKNFKILVKTLVAVFGFYYIPSIINSFFNMDTEVGKFIKGLITYVFTPLISITIGIIYIYIIKISINGELLKNSIFFILSLIFITAFPVVVMLKNYKENKIIKRVINIISYSYIPFIFLQIYAINTRVKAYALTVPRYMGYILIIFEIFFIALLIFKKSKHLDKSILIMAILVFIGTVSPLNIEEVPCKSQANRFKKIYGNAQKFDELSENDKEECYKIYIYLKGYDKEDYIEISNEDKEKMLSDNEYNVVKDEYHEIYCKKPIDGFDISQYSTIYETIYEMENFNDGLTEGFDISLYSYNRDINVDINLKEYIEKMIEYNENNLVKTENYSNNRYSNKYTNYNYEYMKNIFEQNNILESKDKSTSIYLTSFSIEYNKSTKEIRYINLNGYLLKK